MSRLLLFALVTATLAGVGLRSARAADGDRPALRVAMGMGLSVDGDAPNPRPDRPLTAFFFAGGLGDRLWGAELRLFANGATQKQISRIAGELAAVVRPFALWAPPRRGYGARVLRTLALDAGPSYERVSKATFSKIRFGAAGGGHVELPIGPPAGTHELRLRLGARHLFAASAKVGDDRVRNTALELYALLGLVF